MPREHKLEPLSRLISKPFQYDLMPHKAEEKLDGLEKLSVILTVSSIVLAALFPYPATKIFLGFTLGLFFAYLSFARIDLALCFFIFFMPVLDLFPATFLGIKGMNAQTLIIALLLIGSFSQANKSIIRDSTTDPLKLPIIFFISVVLISIINSSVFGRHSFLRLLTIAKQWLVYITLYFIVLKKCDRKFHKKLLFSILIIITIAVTFSMKTFISGGLVLSEGHRNTGVVIGNQPNLFGGFLAMYTPFFVSILYTKVKWRLFWGAGLIICLAALITTLSRGSWLAFFASMVFLGIIKDRRIFIIIALVLISSPLWMPSAAVDRYEQTFIAEGSEGRLGGYGQSYDTSTEVRMRQWKGLFKMMAPNPILGTGFETFPDVVFKSGVLPFRIAAHSTLKRMAVEEGILGIIAYLGLLIAVFNNSWYVFRKSKDPFEQALAVGLLGCIISLFIADLSGSRFYNSELTAYFWIITAMVVKTKIDLSNIEHSIENLSKRKRFVQG